MTERYQKIRPRLAPPPREYSLRLRSEATPFLDILPDTKLMSVLPLMDEIAPVNQKLTIAGGGNGRKYSPVIDRR